jgi:methylated-DNA-[protein]-cysteine S-methyltransferase
MEVIRYAADGWGVGEIVVDGAVLLHSEHPRRGASGSDPEWGQTPNDLARRLVQYFGGARDEFLDVQLDLDGATPFQAAVVDTMRAIPYGELATYGEVAALAGHPGAQRAVGNVCAHNRWAVVVPCHRVVSADGLGPYGSLGPSYKRRMLELEGAAL